MPLRLTVRENAYHFLEQSLRHVDTADTDEVGLKFAVILAAQGIELLLKARLEMEHPLLVLSDLDKPKQRTTVSVDAAVVRLKRSGVAIDAADEERIARARRLRNEFMHYEVNATAEQMMTTHADLFEFAHVFHLDAFGSELHDQLNPDVWVSEAITMERFTRAMVRYQGSTMVAWFPSQLVDAQFVRDVEIEGSLFDRVPYGNEGLPLPKPHPPCNDCGAIEGQLHHFGCDLESCPRCGQQLISCDCDSEPVWTPVINGVRAPSVRKNRSTRFDSETNEDQPAP
ncbi:MAG: hypothetical protein JWN39_1179 [Ilumatobacteraceae bacterium]|nr:hypothetical protein [Ilumatobacteraceae bacterium]